MSPDDARVFALEFRCRLFHAIDERNFTRISVLGREYGAAVRQRLSTCSAADMSQLEPLLSAPLRDAILYLRAVRAHQSTTFRKLARDKAYGSTSRTAKTRRRLRLTA